MGRADAVVIGGAEPEQVRHLAQIGVLGGADLAVGHRDVEQPAEQVFEHGAVVGEQPRDLAGIALEPVRCCAAPGRKSAGHGLLRRAACGTLR